MCNINLADIRQNAIEQADTLIGDRDLNTMPLNDFKQISNQLVDYINREVSRFFPRNEHSDSSDSAKEEIRISFAVANHLNNNLNGNRTVEFNQNMFVFSLIEKKAD